MPDYKFTFDQVKQASKGRVLDILRYFAPGYDWGKALKGHHFCPVHVGKNGDAFKCLDPTKKGLPSFNDHPLMVCNSCHGMKPVSGIINCVMWLTGSNDEYKTMREIAEYLGLDSNSEKPAPKPKKVYVKPKPVRNAYAAETLRKTWKEALPISNPQAYKIIKTYLESRGLSVPPSPIMRLAPAMEYRYKERYDDDNKKWIYGSKGFFPTILTLMVTTVENVPMNIHRTFLDPVTYEKASLFKEDGKQLKSKKMMTPVVDGMTPKCCMRLFNPINGVIGVAEGIETCMAVYQATGLPMWSMSNQYGLRTALFGPNVKVVLPFGDLDLPDIKGVQVGVDAVKELTERVIQSGKISEYFLPELDLTGRDKGVDWLDMLNMFGPSVFPDVSGYLMAA